ncbi:hypothetical protein AVEN_79100-1 [Araneus ventricosus]|uniref:Uncharacterized protein n=1 Tax=Araneus ventricosus TaxID=182803 RepID=A0A4Y2EPJ7_ARAVE|nr:hypothetical protein AVEN_36954-1 [Araneus ventricosus]GBM31238.1 hypothetical protein AVEN_79100-1 [Araneus ventricosus]
MDFVHIEFELFLHVHENFIVADYPSDQDQLEECFDQDELKDDDDSEDKLIEKPSKKQVTIAFQAVQHDLIPDTTGTG